MKLHQLRYLVAIADNDLNMTAAALALHTVQPGVSRQITLLEAELGLKFFVRKGKALVRTTPSGEQVIARARQVLRQINEIKSIAAELVKDENGSLSIATTHTQARYVLPPALQRFRELHPKVRIHLYQGNSEQIADMVARDRIDLAIATGDGDGKFAELIRLPCYHWRRVIVVPRGHPLAETAAPTLEQLAEQPLITYSFSFVGRSSLLDLFSSRGLVPNVAFTAWDSDVIKAYVRRGFGVGIVADLAIDSEDSDLVTIDAKHLFPEHTTWVGFRRGALLRRYMYGFIALLAPHLTRHEVQRLEALSSQAEVDAAFAAAAIPSWRERL